MMIWQVLESVDMGQFDREHVQVVLSGLCFYQVRQGRLELKSAQLLFDLNFPRGNIAKIQLILRIATGIVGSPGGILSGSEFSQRKIFVSRSSFMPLPLSRRYPAGHYQNPR